MARRRNTKRDYDEEEDDEGGVRLAPETKQGILVIFLFTASILGILALVNAAGTFGEWIDIGLRLSFGWTRFAFPFILLVIGFLLLYPERYALRKLHMLGLVFLVLAFQGILHLSIDMDRAWTIAMNGEGGGFLGYIAAFPLYRVTGWMATMLILIAVFFAAFLLTFETSLARIADHWKATARIGRWARHRMLSRQYGGTSDDDAEDEDAGDDFSEREIDEEAEEGDEADDDEGEERDEDDGEDSEEEEEAEEGDADSAAGAKTTAGATTTPKDQLRSIDMPVDLLEGKASKPTSGDIATNVELIEQTFANFGITVEMGDVLVGPTVTQYTLRPADGVRIAKISGLSNDLALALAAHPIRIEAPIPGKSLVGIEVPNQKVAIVRLRALLDSTEFRDRPHNMMVALGKDVAGKPWFADLTRMPHMLVAGATGSGKSVCLNAIILSLLYQNGPDQLKFIFVDPKRVELTVYDGIPHLLTPVVTDVKKTVNALRWLLTEMDRRFDLLQKNRKRDIASYNKTAGDYMPYIVLVIDELADLMVAAANDVEGSIIRLAQMARAVGIHLVLATQRPSVDVITGLIKANVPARIAFSVASGMDSRTILDSSGAEKLLGRGDLLFTNAELSKPKRLQGAFVSDSDIQHVVTHISKSADANYDESILERQTTTSDGSVDGIPSEYDDPMIPDAKEVIREAGKASASLLQRRLRIGYARAARLLDILENMGFIGPADGAKPREILNDRPESAIMNPASKSSKVSKSSPDDDSEEEVDDEEEGEDDVDEEDGDDGEEDEEAEEESEDDEDGDDAEADDEEEFDEDEYLEEQEGEYEDEKSK